LPSHTEPSIRNCNNPSTGRLLRTYIPIILLRAVPVGARVSQYQPPSHLPLFCRYSFNFYAATILRRAALRAYQIHSDFFDVRTIFRQHLVGVVGASEVEGALDVVSSVVCFRLLGFFRTAQRCCPAPVNYIILSFGRVTPKFYSTVRWPVDLRTKFRTNLWSNMCTLPSACCPINYFRWPVCGASQCTIHKASRKIAWSAWRCITCVIRFDIYFIHTAAHSFPGSM